MFLMEKKKKVTKKGGRTVNKKPTGTFMKKPASRNVASNKKKDAVGVRRPTKTTLGPGTILEVRERKGGFGCFGGKEHPIKGGVVKIKRSHVKSDRRGSGRQNEAEAIPVS